MQLIVTADYRRLSEQAAEHVARVVERKPAALLVLPTGDSPLGMYQCLLKIQRQRALDFSQARIAVLDEWGGLGREHPLSCHFCIKHTVADPAGIRAENLYSLDGAAADPRAECRRYSQLLEELGPPDIAVLGVGLNGHIGFNEPSETLMSEAHVSTLAQATREKARVSMNGIDPPSFGLTMGMAQVMQAKQLLVLISGRPKAQIAGQMLNGPISTHLPASLLKLHPQAILFMDSAAATLDT